MRHTRLYVLFFCEGKTGVISRELAEATGWSLKRASKALSRAQEAGQLWRKEISRSPREYVYGLSSGGLRALDYWRDRLPESILFLASRLRTGA